MTPTGPCPRSEDAPLFALAVLDGDEAVGFAAHARVCPDCRRELAAHRQVVGRMQESFARVPAPSFDDLAFAGAPLPPRRRVRYRLVGALGALAVATVVLALALGGSGTGPAATANVHSELAGASTTGQARLYHPDRVDGLVRLRLSDVPPAAPGTYYEVWVLPRGSTTMEPVGSFVPRSRSVALSLRLPGSGDYAAIDISIQQTGRASRHSGRSLAGGAFAAA